MQLCIFCLRISEVKTCMCLYFYSFSYHEEVFWQEVGEGWDANAAFLPMNNDDFSSVRGERKGKRASLVISRSSAIYTEQKSQKYSSIRKLFCLKKSNWDFASNMDWLSASPARAGCYSWAECLWVTLRLGKLHKISTNTIMTWLELSAGEQATWKMKWLTGGAAAGHCAVVSKKTISEGDEKTMQGDNVMKGNNANLVLLHTKTNITNKRLVTSVTFAWHQPLNEKYFTIHHFDTVWRCPWMDYGWAEQTILPQSSYSPAEAASVQPFPFPPSSLSL